MIDGLGFTEKRQRPLRQALNPDEQLFDAIDIAGTDRWNSTISGVLLVSAERLVFVKDKIFGKPEVKEIPATMTEARDAHAAVERSRSQESMADMAAELRQRRGF